MEALELLAAGDDGVREAGYAEYINLFFDFVADSPLDPWRDMSTLTADEVNALDSVQQLLLETGAATPQITTDIKFVRSGWPERIKPVAADALELMRQRGRFSEDREEDTPSK